MIFLGFYAELSWSELIIKNVRKTSKSTLVTKVQNISLFPFLMCVSLDLSAILTQTGRWGVGSRVRWIRQTLCIMTNNKMAKFQAENFYLSESLWQDWPQLIKLHHTVQTSISWWEVLWQASTYFTAEMWSSRKSFLPGLTTIDKVEKWGRENCRIFMLTLFLVYYLLCLPIMDIVEPKKQ